MLSSFVDYVLSHIDDTESRLSISGWKIGDVTKINAEQFEMVDAFLHFLKGKYIIQLNYKNCGKSSPCHSHYKMRDRNKTRLDDPKKRHELIQEFLGVYNGS